MSLKFKSLIALMLALVLCLSSFSALACTAIYVGSDLTTDGSTMYARSEDYGNASYNKLFYFSPAGTYKARELYVGCYGFTWTLEKDSYSFTTMSDDNWAGVESVCPDCGSTHKHNPYGAAGTNEMGVSVSATETLYTSSPVYDLDPYLDAGIEEAEITTILLSQSATAKEAVDLLLEMYDAAGANLGSGIFIGDDKECWYVENVTGTQYVAVKLNGGLAFSVPNLSVIGLIDLDDTENVIASDKLIALAKEAGTYVGDEEANTIDYVASYNGDQKAKDSGRMMSALTYLYGDAIGEDPANSAYTISNVDAEGNIVPFYSNIKLDRAYSISDIEGYYNIPGIGKGGNLETHIFQIFPEDSLTDTVEWVAMDNAIYSPFVPYYPMLTTDTYEAYQVSTATTTFVEEEPAEGIYCPASSWKRTEEGRVKVDGFKVLPENWAESYYWSIEALSDLMDYSDVTEEEAAAVKAKIAKLQVECYAAYDDLKAAVKAVDSEAAAKAVATEISAQMAAKVHAEVVEMVNDLLK